MIRFTLIGDSCVGKSTLVNYLINGKEQTMTTTIGVSFNIYEDEKKYMIVDTSGTMRMLVITSEIIKSYDNTVIVYHTDRQKEKWEYILESIKYEGIVDYLRIENKIGIDNVKQFKKIMNKMEECVKEKKTY